MAATIGPKPASRLIWNASESVPIGRYRVQTAGPTDRRRSVVVLPPDELAIRLAEGGYLPHGVPPIKRILALPKQIVCRSGPTITVDGIAVARRAKDRCGRLLPNWGGAQSITAKVFIMNWGKPASLCGRYSDGCKARPLSAAPSRLGRSRRK